MTKKFTKKEMFAMVAEIVKGVEHEHKNELLEFVAHETELLENKKSKSTKTQKENEILMEHLVVALQEFDKPVTITEFQKESSHEIATLSNQKLSSLLKKLVEEKRVIRTTEKKKAYFSVA